MPATADRLEPFWHNGGSMEADRKLEIYLVKPPRSARTFSLALAIQQARHIELTARPTFLKP